MKIIEILNEINQENGSKYKLSILEKYRDNKEFQKVLKLTYDKVKYNFYVTPHTLKKPEEYEGKVKLSAALKFLEIDLAKRWTTGKDAITETNSLLRLLSKEDAEVVWRILDRDLRININSKSINKVFKKLITEFPYMRCSLPDKLDRIKYPAFIQLKCDGTYRTIVKDGDEIRIYARSGEESTLPMFKKKIKNLPDGAYIGELLIKGYSSKDRLKANGLINSDTEPENIYMVAWDYLTLDEWKEGKSKTDYIKRFRKLEENIQNETVIQPVMGKIVENFEEAQEFYRYVVSQGEEGAVLKNLDNKFKNGTATDNIKMKEEAVAEFRITGFQEGTGRFTGTLGALEVISEDGKVESKVSGFTDEMRDYIWKNRDKLLDTIVSVKYNGVTKAKNKDTYGLMFPVFVELRTNEKYTADNLDYIKKSLK